MTYTCAHAHAFTSGAIAAAAPALAAKKKLIEIKWTKNYMSYRVVAVSGAFSIPPLSRCILYSIDMSRRQCAIVHDTCKYSMHTRR